MISIGILEASSMEVVKVDWRLEYLEYVVGTSVAVMGVEFLVETTIVAPDGTETLLLIILEDLVELVPLSLSVCEVALILNRLLVTLGIVDCVLKVALFATLALEEPGFIMLVADWLEIMLALTLLVVGIIEVEP